MKDFFTEAEEEVFLDISHNSQQTTCESLFKKSCRPEDSN